MSSGKDSSTVLGKPGHRLEISYVPITKLKTPEDNPRDHTPRQIKQIARSMSAFGFISPIVIDPECNVIAGVGRVLAARRLGLTEAPTVSVNHLDEKQLKAFRIADNRLTENSTWNERLLGEQLKFLSDSELDFSIEVTGFEIGEIDVYIEGLTQESEQNDPADALPESTKLIPVTRTGDRWLLDDSVVLCADALNEGSYRELLGDQKAVMAFVDPPYNVPIENNVSGLGAIRHRDFGMACGEMSKQQFTEFLTRLFSLLARSSIDGSLHYIFMDWRHMSELLSAGEKTYSELQNLCIWTKNHTGMGAFYRSRHELIFVYKYGRAPHRNNIMLGKYGRDRTNVWSYPSPRTPSEEGNLLALHPTVKPVRMIADAIMDCTARGDIVLDACMGSGSTLLGAERTGRRCFGLEIDPHYVDTIVRRWQAYTRKQAVHAESGKFFNQLEAEAEEARSGGAS
jgi:DNA modification methylase